MRKKNPGNRYPLIHCEENTGKPYIAEAHNNKEGLAYALNNIGDIFNREGNYQQALVNELKAELLNLKEEFDDGDEKYPELVEQNKTQF